MISGVFLVSCVLGSTFRETLVEVSRIPQVLRCHFSPGLPLIPDLTIVRPMTHPASLHPASLHPASLHLGLPKGRMYAGVLALMAEAGINIRSDARTLPPYLRGVEVTCRGNGCSDPENFIDKEPKKEV